MARMSTETEPAADGLPEGVGWTALLIAYARAQESLRADRKLDDPLAAGFIEAIGDSASGAAGLPPGGPLAGYGSSTLWNAFGFYWTERTVFYDQQILKAVAAGCRQLVLLGAGLDSRAFRLGLPGSTTVFELDQAPVLHFKQAVLDRNGAAATCRRIPLAVDLRTDWPRALSEAGFDPSQPTAWVAEGLLMFLSRSDADQLLDRITALSAAGSRIAAEYWSKPWLDSDLLAETTGDQDRATWDQARRAFLYGPMPESPASWLIRHGWSASEVITLVELGRQGDRSLPPEFVRPSSPDVWLFDGSFH
jgi:methyltransferase (TIGR00027 family)